MSAPPTSSLWSKRSILKAMVLREWRIRYAGTGLKWLWLILRPLLQLSVYAAVFTMVLKVDTHKTPYILHLLTGLITWQIFLEIINSAGRATQFDVDLIKKTTIPRLYLPLYRSLLCIPDIGVFILLYTAISIYWGQSSGWQLVFVPFSIFANWLFAFGVSCWVCVWGVFRRDLFQLFYTVVSYTMWLTPIFYHADMVPQPYGYWLGINPLAGIAALYRFSFYAEPFPAGTWLCIIPGLLIPAIGYYLFRRREDEFGDFI